MIEEEKYPVNSPSAGCQFGHVSLTQQLGTPLRYAWTLSWLHIFLKIIDKVLNLLLFANYLTNQ